MVAVSRPRGMSESHYSSRRADVQVGDFLKYGLVKRYFQVTPLEAVKQVLDEKKGEGAHGRATVMRALTGRGTLILRLLVEEDAA